MKRSIFYVLMILLITASFVWSGDIYDRSNRLWTGTHTLHKTNTSTATVKDGLTLKQSTTGTPAAGLGVGIAFQIEDLGGLEEQGSLDYIMTDVTDASENVDITLTANTEGTLREVYSIDSQASATTGTIHDFTSWTIETNGVIDMVKLTLDNTADTATDGFGLGISFELEDETDAAEQQASMDVVLTDAGTGTEDADFVFSQNRNGTIQERVRFDADGPQIQALGLLPSIHIGDGGDEDIRLRFDGNTTEGHFQICVDDADDDLHFGSGTITEGCGSQTAFQITDAATPALTVTAATTFNAAVIRTGQQLLCPISGVKLGASGAGWTLNAADSLNLATLAASQTSENIVIPVNCPLKVGSTITAFSVVGQIESAGNTVTLDADLRKHTAAAGDVADASVDTITQISVTADTAVSTSKTLGTPEVIAADETFYVVLLGTTAASTDVAIQGITITLTEN